LGKRHAAKHKLDFRMNQASAPFAPSSTLRFSLLFSLLVHVGLILGWSEEWRHPAPIAPITPRAPLLARLVEPPTPASPPKANLRLKTTNKAARPKPSTTTSPKPPPILRAPASLAPSPTSSPTPSPTPETAPLETLAASARRQLDHLARQEGFYPLEAIQNRWQGEAWVQIFMDDNGHVIAARIEESSGYPILDAAALKAARALSALPADGLESVVLPVRFRLTQ
jgi:protein TonB